MTNGEVKFALRKLCTDLFGPGYPLVQSADGTHTFEQLYLYYWQFDKENGPANVYIDIMANHGGDAALRARPGFGTWH